jgi:hypothetical protein
MALSLLEKARREKYVLLLQKFNAPLTFINRQIKSSLEADVHITLPEVLPSNPSLNVLSREGMNSNYS